MFFRSVRPVRRAVRFRPFADRLEDRAAPTADLVGTVAMPNAGGHDGPIYAGGDGPSCEIARINPMLLPPTTE